MAGNKLSTQDVHGSDPIAQLVFGKLNANTFSITLFFLISGIACAFILPRFWGFQSESDYNNLLNFIVVYPAVGYFYANQPKSILRVYNSVGAFFRDDDVNLKFPREKIIDWHNREIWYVPGFVLGILGMGLGVRFSIAHFEEHWYSADWLAIFIVQGIRFFAYYAIALSASRHIATSIMLNQLFSNAPFPLTLDTDRLDIFSSVKRFALGFVGIAAVIGLSLGIQPLLIDLPLLEFGIYVTLYFIVAPFSFFLPVLGAHRRMAKIKNDILDRLNEEFQETSQKIYANLTEKRSAERLKEMDRLVSIQKAAESVSNTPDWPFQGTTVYRMAITVVSPFFLVIWDIGINLAGNLLVK